MRYVIRPVGDAQKTTDPLRRLATVRALRKRIGPGGPPWHTSPRGSNTRWTRVRWRGQRRLMTKLLELADVGDTFTVKGERGREYSVRAVDPAPKVVLPEQAAIWPDEQKTLYAYVFGKRWRNGKPAWWGSCNCRPPRGSSSGWSDHACCGALDVGVGTNKALGDEIFEDVMGQQERLKIRYSSWCGIRYKTECTYHGDHLHISTRQCSGCS